MQVVTRGGSLTFLDCLVALQHLPTGTKIGCSDTDFQECSCLVCTAETVGELTCPCGCWRLVLISLIAAAPSVLSCVSLSVCPAGKVCLG